MWFFPGVVIINYGFEINIHVCEVGKVNLQSKLICAAGKEKLMGKLICATGKANLVHKLICVADMLDLRVVPLSIIYIKPRDFPIWGSRYSEHKGCTNM